MDDVGAIIDRPSKASPCQGRCQKSSIFDEGVVKTDCFLSLSQKSVISDSSLIRGSLYRCGANLKDKLKFVKISGRLPKEGRKKLAFRTVAGMMRVLYNVRIQVDYAYSTTIGMIPLK